MTQDEREQSLSARAQAYLADQQCKEQDKLAQKKAAAKSRKVALNAQSLNPLPIYLPMPLDLLVP